MKTFTLLCVLIVLFVSKQFGATTYDMVALLLASVGILVVVIHRPAERLFFQWRIARDVFGRRQSDHRAEPDVFDGSPDRRMRPR